MGCPTIAELEELVGRTASGAVESVLGSHVHECVRCRDEVRQIRENQAFMRDALRDLGQSGRAVTEPGAGTPLTSFRIVRVIARGGQGVIHEAVQVKTKRRIALKIIEPGEPNALHRFEREAELASGLRHPNIVTIYESEMLPDGRYALAMEYVEGVRLDEWVQAKNRKAMPTREGAIVCIRSKLGMFLQICDGVHHAHVNGVIHRDLKPSNILVTHDDSPRIVDFGIARRVANATQLTRAGGFAGTLAYASPEQVSGDRGTVDTRTDVYSLGLILYEMLTERRPYDTESSLSGALTNITKSPPEPMRVMQPGDVPAGSELESIIEKALTKEREDRYQSVSALRSDIENWLSGRPVQAHHQHTMYLVRKLVARHRVGFSICLAFVLLCVALAVSMTWSSQRLSEQRSLLASALTSSTVERGRLMGITGENARAEELIWPVLIASRHDVRSPDLSFNSPPGATQAAWALYELYSRHPSMMYFQAPPGLHAIRFEKADKQLRLVSLNGSQTVLSLPDATVLGTLPPITDAVPLKVELDTNRKHFLLSFPGHAIALNLDTQSQSIIRHDALDGASVRDLSADTSRFLLLTTAGTLSLWRTDPVAKIRDLAESVSSLSKVHFCRNGRFITAGVGNQILMWQSEDGEVSGAWKVPTEGRNVSARAPIYTTAVSPDGKFIAAGVQNAVMIFSVNNPDLPPRIIASAHRGFISWIEFSENSSKLLTYGIERSCKVWNPATGELIGAFEQPSPLRGVPALASCGTLIGICDEVGRVRLFECHPQSWLTKLGPADNTFHAAQLSPDQNTLAAISADGKLSAWTMSDLSPLWMYAVAPTILKTMCFSPSGDKIAVGGQDGGIHLISAADPKAASFFGQCDYELTWLGYSPDGRILAASGASTAIDIFDAESGGLIKKLSGHSARVVQGAFTADGELLITVGADGIAIAWNLVDGSEKYRTLPIHDSTRAIAISPNGQHFATGSDDWKIRLWDIRTGTLVRTFTGAKQHVFGLAFHPDGNLLFSCGRDSAVQVWDVRTGRELAVLAGHTDLVLSVAVSADGRKLITASADGTTGVWDLDYYRSHLIGNAKRWAAVR